MDTGTNAAWGWTDAELNRYLEAWQDRVQEEHELVWGTATITQTGSATVTLTDVASDILRPHRITWNVVALIPKTKEDLEMLDRQWRGYGTSTQPAVVYQDRYDTVSVWPPPSGASGGTMVFEYPKELTFATDTSTMGLPAWTKYSAINYGAFRSYVRNGLNHNAEKAQRYRNIFYQQLQRFGVRKRNFFPKQSLAFRPASLYEGDILDPFGVIAGLTLPSNAMAIIRFEDEVPTGAVNGVNTSYTLSTAPNPVAGLELSLDGVELVKDTHYTLSGVTVTMATPPGPPATGQSLFAHYRYEL